MGCKGPRRLGGLVRRLRTHGDLNGVTVAERLERGLLAGVAIVGTSRPEAEAVLAVIDAWTPERLREVSAALRGFVGRASSSGCRAALSTLVRVRGEV
jgi:hypothetical protein